MTRTSRFSLASRGAVSDSEMADSDYPKDSVEKNRMDHWTLCFQDPVYERKYVRATVRYGLLRMEAFNIFFLCYLLIEFFISTYDIRDIGFILDLWSTTGRIVYNVCYVVLFVVHLSVCLFIRAVSLRYVSTSFLCEHVFAANVTFWCLIFPFVNRWRVVSLFGSDRDASFPPLGGSGGYIDDSVTLSANLAGLGYASLVVPIRLHTTVGLCSIFALSMAWSTLAAGSPSENNPFYNFVGMFMYFVVIVVIKRDLEKSVRIAYVMQLNALKSSSQINKILSQPAHEQSLCRLEIAREKLITLGNCIACDDKSKVLPSTSHRLDNLFEDDDVKQKLIDEVLVMLSSPHTLLSRAPEAIPVNGHAASLTAIQKFMAENFIREKEALPDDETQSGELYYSECESLHWGSSEHTDVDEEDVRDFCKDFLFNVVKLYRSIGNRTLITLLPQEIQRYVRDVDSEINAFTHSLSSGYTSTSYHNEAHAAQVVNHGEYLARSLFVTRESSTIERLSFLIATAAHDVAHFGRNNKFCIATKHEVALTYNDKSVLENMHASITFRLLEDPSKNILKKTSDADYRSFRSFVVDLILATDMSLNADAMSAFRLRSHCEDFCLATEVDRKSCYRIIIKAADIGHGALKWEDHCAWSYWLCAEFFEQGDQERALNLPISALCDRNDCDFPASQQGFLRFCCIPLFECLSAIPVARANPRTIRNSVFKPVPQLILDTESDDFHINKPDAILQQIEANFMQWKKLEESNLNAVEADKERK